MSKASSAPEGNRDNFKSQFGLIMAAVGSAVGLGNIWRFSYIVGKNGGGAFIIVYLLCVILVGIPVLIAELTIGRRTGLSSFSAFKKLAPTRKPWWITGIIAILAPTIIMAYYPVVAGWSLGYVWNSLFNWNSIVADTGGFFTSFISNNIVFMFTALALLLTVVINFGGIAAGIEKANKILMPALAVILVVLVVRSLTLGQTDKGNALSGVAFMFVPKFGDLSLQGVLDALGHSFFSLSLGMGIIITYGSYMKKDANLPSAAASIITLDTGIALLAGLAIFPAVFAFGLDPGQGAGLAFITLPMAFAQMPLGNIFSALFFLLIFIAALTSMMSLLQVPVAFFQDEFKWSKKKAILIVTAFIIIIGFPSVMANSVNNTFLIGGRNYFDFLDHISNNILLPVTGLLTVLFVIFQFGVANSKEEFLEGSPKKGGLLAGIYPFAVKFIAPIAIILVLLNATGLFKMIFRWG